MTQETRERRSHDRRSVSVPIELVVELHGFDDSDRRFRAAGKTVNVSRGGLLALLDRAVDPGLRCLTHFPRASGKIGRTMIYGVVRRSRPVADGHEVAVLFDTPLQRVEMPAATTP